MHFRIKKKRRDIQQGNGLLFVYIKVKPNQGPLHLPPVTTNYICIKIQLTSYIKGGKADGLHIDFHFRKKNQPPSGKKKFKRQNSVWFFMPQSYLDFNLWGNTEMTP